MTMKKLILLLCLCIPFSLFAQREKDMALNIVYIGNSITQGALLKNPKEEAPPVLASAWLKNQKGIAEVNMSNQGVSGKTTVDYLPASKTYFPKVRSAMETMKEERPKALPLFSIMLGTNDSKAQNWVLSVE